MQTFSKPADTPAATVHVALLDGDGAVIIHEEIPAASVPLRLKMLELTAELDVRDIEGASRKVYAGEVWPPEGCELKKGKVVEVATP